VSTTSLPWLVTSGGPFLSVSPSSWAPHPSCSNELTPPFVDFAPSQDGYVKALDVVFIIACPAAIIAAIAGAFVKPINVKKVGGMDALMAAAWDVR
jgi:hypothetical protein